LSPVDTPWIAYGVSTLWLLFQAAVLYLVPGGGVVVWVLHDGDWIERLVVGAGVSVVVYALAFYASLVGVRLGPTAVVSLLILGAVAIGMRVVVTWRSRRCPLAAQARRLLGAWRRDPAYLVLALVATLVLGVRIWILRDMVAPRWGDSYQHTMITQLLIDHGGIFDSWEPYVPYAGLTTHFAFHANAAFFHWLTGADASRSVMWVGQILNVLAVLALYPLGKRVGGHWSGVLAVVVSGLLTAVPMVYVNWGRYPQLAGQALLPLAVWLLWLALERPTLDWILSALAGLLAAGQVLGYYRMPYFYATLVGGLFLAIYVVRLRAQWRAWGSLVLRLLIVGVIAVVLLAPWAIHIAQSRLMAFVVSGAEYGRTMEDLRNEYVQWRSLPLYVSTPLLVTGGVALLLALRKRSGPAIALGLWFLGLFALVATRMIGLPGTTHLNSFSSMIFAYAPISLLIGWLGAQVLTTMDGRRGTKGQWAMGGLLILLALVGAYQSIRRSDPAYDLVKQADLDAMEWIRTHTPPNTRFLVNGFSIYDGQSVVGSDAGWWIPLLTERANTMPPQYALINERETEPGYGRRIVELQAALRRTPLTTPEGLGWLCDEGITHVYVGQVEGRVGVPPPEPLFTAEEMLATPAFEPVYHWDKVWIFALTNGACGSLIRE